MPTVSRPDGATLDWESEGEGPPVVITSQLFSDRLVSRPLIDELAPDHTVFTYDARGTGASSPEGPYDLDTDAADIGAIAEQASGPVVLVGLGNGSDAAVILASERPDLVRAVVVAFGNPAGLRVSGGTEALSGSDSVVDVLIEMMERDYRGALRSVITTGNPQMSEDEVRDRVKRQEAYCPGDVAAVRLAAWRASRVFDQALSLGDRLLILQHPYNPWFPAELIEPMREVLPEAEIRAVEDGHLSRPDITAGVVREITAERI
jgi:pimeloyl-ACP methyl ester carboxylesterase